MFLGDNDDPVFSACRSHSSDGSHAAKISALATKKECTLCETGSARALADNNVTQHTRGCRDIAGQLLVAALGKPTVP